MRTSRDPFCVPAAFVSACGPFGSSGIPSWWLTPPRSPYVYVRVDCTWEEVCYHFSCLPLRLCEGRLHFEFEKFLIGRGAPFSFLLAAAVTGVGGLAVNRFSARSVTVTPMRATMI